MAGREKSIWRERSDFVVKQVMDEADRQGLNYKKRDDLLAAAYPFSVLSGKPLNAWRAAILAELKRRKQWTDPAAPLPGQLDIPFPDGPATWADREKKRRKMTKEHSAP